MLARPQAFGLSEDTPTQAPVKVLGLKKRFGARTILDGIDLSLEMGAVVALIGANGAGKSTLLRCCMRLIEPDEGFVEILGTKVSHAKSRTLRHIRSQVGVVFQKHNLSGRLSALSNVVHGVQARTSGPRTWLQGLAPPAYREEAMAMLETVGLAGHAATRADQLSGGQSQRVAIARALMQRPRLILADEPVASLDPAAGTEIMQLLTGLARAKGVTVLLTTHSLEHACRYADRIVGLADGKIFLDGPARSLPIERLRKLYDPR